MPKKQSIYDYLTSTGVLETGDDVAIKTAKQQYWKEYRNSWKQQKRKAHNSYTVLLTAQENRQVQSAARQQQTSPTQYIKQSAVTRTGGISIELTGTIRQLLYQCYREVEELMEENKIHDEITKVILEKISTLEKHILKNIQPF